MAATHKILLLDDDEQMLELYQQLLRDLPSRPEVQTSSSGARAIALLESESFTLLITDLRMPKMDGLQVLSIVRRKFPHLRIIVLTGLVDEEFRSRAYAQGVELFWQKPSNGEEMQFFKDCVESLLDRDHHSTSGFRGMQSKNLVDLIQLECLSGGSSSLRITQGINDGRIWVQEGDIIDAATGDLRGEDAFREILSWQSGNFEILPAEKHHPRTITGSGQALLLNSAQKIDEEKGRPQASETEMLRKTSPLAALGRYEGVEFALAVPYDVNVAATAWGAENVEQIATWARDTWRRMQHVGERLHCGKLAQVHALGLQRHVGLGAHPDKGVLCVGFRRSVLPAAVEQTMKQLFTKWAS
jgi:CheY-like chemotaxis protein